MQHRESHLITVARNVNEARLRKEFAQADDAERLLRCSIDPSLFLDGCVAFDFESLLHCPARLDANRVRSVVETRIGEI
jgi:hypothetical protein